MAGQGSPSPTQRFCWLAAIVCLSLCQFLGGAVAQEPIPERAAEGVPANTLRLRLAWGGGESRAWQGKIRLSEGRILEFSPLGLEADTPGSMWLTEQGDLRVASRSPRTYDGCDITIDAPMEGRIIVEFSGPDGQPLPPVEIELAKAARSLEQQNLDEHKNRILVQRQPGDLLPVSHSRESLVFSTGEKFEFSVIPRSPELNPNTTYILTATLTYARTTDEVSSDERELRTNIAGEPEGETSFNIPMPQNEGAFDIRLALYPKRITTPLVKGKALAERRVQVVVLEQVKTARKTDYLLNPFGSLTGEPTSWESVLEFDPASPRWWEKMTRIPTAAKIPGINIPGLGQQTYGSQQPKIRAHLDQSLVELAGGAWQAYPLSITSIGMPHFLEILYPSDLSQTLQVSILEPNAAGEVTPISVDTGIDVPRPVGDARGEMRRHKIVFWPQTKSPLVLFANRRDDAPAFFGKIRVLGGPRELAAVRITPAAPPRLFAASLERPLICESFSAPESLDDATGRSRRDWLTFYLAGKRLVEYLEHTGRNGLVLSVAGEGSSLYPSAALQPTPHFDGGTFFETGQDPQQKDVVEMLLRMCDRAGIQFIPAVRFTTPLPELETLLRDETADPTGIVPLGIDGRPLSPRPQSRQGKAPTRQGEGRHYNPLDPRVQQAMRSVVLELAQRYGHHPSFGGISIQMSTEGYAVLPDDTASLDDVTFNRFLNDSSLSLRDEGEHRYAARFRLIRSADGRHSWNDWRAEELARLYREMEADISRTHSGAKLYLNTSELFATRQLESTLRPALPQVTEVQDPLLPFGLDPHRFAKQPNIIIPRPQRLDASSSPAHNLHSQWNKLPELDAIFVRQSAAVLHFYEPAPHRLPSFDKQSPFGPDKTHTFFVPPIAQAGDLARQPLVHSLAVADVHTLLSGGWTLSLGQEDSVADIIGVYRRLPAETFRTLTLPPEETAGAPLVVRTLARGNKSFFYLVNDSPWPLKVELEMECPELFQLESYVADRAGKLKRQASRSIWSVDLQPFDLVGGELSSGKVKFATWRVTLSEPAEPALRDRIREARVRASALREPQPKEVLTNPSFEIAQKAGGISGWTHANGPGIAVNVDGAQGYKSDGSLHLVSTPIQNEAGKTVSPIIWVRSNPFPAPKTGRLSVLAWVRVDDPRKQPKLRLAVEGKLDGKPFYRRANIGASEDGQAVRPIQKEWSPYRFPLTDLSLDGLTDIQIGFDLMGEGDVYIDQVSVYDLWFADNERDELLKNIATADIQLSSGQIADCERFLDGYWSRFLQDHVPLSAPRIAAAPSASQPPSATPAPRRGPLVKRAERDKTEAPPDKTEVAEKLDKPGMFDRVKGWLPKSPFR
ncbi:MAG: hypothetical protein ACKVP0_15515 [Pirellulaceae bacterium]